MSETGHFYAWPASKIDQATMRLLYTVREASSPRIPISELVRRAVHEAYGKNAMPDATPAGRQHLCATE